MFEFCKLKKVINKIMSKKKNTAGGFTSLMAAIAIVIALVIGIVIYKFILGDASHFVDGDPNGHPIEGDFFGVVYKGGFIVPILLAVNFIVIIFSVERFITLNKAAGKGKNDEFVRKIKSLLEAKKIDEAINECDKQQGSLANVVRAGLEKYKTVINENGLDKEQKIEALKTELEEATALELPMLSKNLVVISTCASTSTLIGLIGTVLGMIRAFSAMGTGGAPDTAALSTGISEALINTMFGILGSCIAIIFYNMFNNKIDQMTHGMDEAGFSIVKDFNESQK